MPRNRMYLHAENKSIEKDMTLFILRYLHMRGYEGDLGHEMQDVQGESVEMSYVEINVEEDWGLTDVQILAHELGTKLETYLQSRYVKEDFEN